MAVAIVSITDSLGTDFTAGGCIEEVEGDVSITISTTATLDTSSIENFGGYVDGSLTDNGDGTWTFDVDKNSLEGDPCLLIKEYTPQDCALVCPTITLTQQVDGVTYSTNFSLESEYSFSDIVINAVTHAGTSGTVIGAVAGDCITYALVLTLLGENGSSCVYSYDLTLPACNTEVVNSDCTTTNYCTVNTPSLAYVCDSGGTITVTATPGNELGVAVVSEWLSWSNDGLNYTTFTDSFITSESTGYIKYEIDYEDGCDLQELIIPFLCTVDCDGTFDYNCTYLSGTNQFVATFTDNNTVPIQTDVIEYFIDGSLVGIPYVSGTLIDGTGINRIDWQRTIVFDAPCPDVVLDFSCAKVDENCDYVGFDLSAVYDSATDSVIPTFTGDESVLDVSDKTYSVDGYTYSIYLGGAIPTNLFATFVWRIQKVGCEPMCLVATAARSGVDFNITNDINNPISIDISNTNPIDINVANDVSVIGNFCCPTQETEGDSGPCPPDATCGTVLTVDGAGQVSWNASLCPDFYDFVLQYNLGGVWVYQTNVSGQKHSNIGEYRLVGTRVGCPDIILSYINLCKTDANTQYGNINGFGIVFDSVIVEDKTLNIRWNTGTNSLNATDRFRIIHNGVTIIDTGYTYDNYTAASCPETNGHPIIDVSGVALGGDIGGLIPINTIGLVVSRDISSTQYFELNLPVLIGDTLQIDHNDSTCASQLGWNLYVECL